MTCWNLPAHFLVPPGVSPQLGVLGDLLIRGLLDWLLSTWRSSSLASSSRWMSEPLTLSQRPLISASPQSRLMFPQTSSTRPRVYKVRCRFVKDPCFSNYSVSTLLRYLYKYDPGPPAGGSECCSMFLQPKLVKRQEEILFFWIAYC